MSQGSTMLALQEAANINELNHLCGQQPIDIVKIIRAEISLNEG
jgi:hypothetical protein